MSRLLQSLCTVLLLTCCLLFHACSTSDPQLLALSKKIKSEQQWKEPLPPNEFVSDGCSLWPDYDWVECCVAHDSIYWMGGTREDRFKADLSMKECVSSTGHPIMGWIMYYGVRAGGVYWLPTSYRWGFGWEYPQSGPPGTSY